MRSLKHIASTILRNCRKANQPSVVNGRFQSQGVINKRSFMLQSSFICKRLFTKIWDYEEIFFSVVRYESIRTFLSIAAEYKLLNLEIEQFDIKTAFFMWRDLYGYFRRNHHSRNRINLSIKKNLGLKQVSRQQIWKFSQTFNFKPCKADSCIYSGNFDNCKVYLALFINDGD